MKKFAAIILFLQSLLLLPGLTSANGTSYFEDSEFPTGHVLPLDDGIVSILREELFIDVKQDSSGFFNLENPTLRADIEVHYEMFNETDEDLTMPIAFPQPGQSDQWNITLDGKEVALTGTINIHQQELMGSDRHDDWIQPRTGETYPFEGFNVLECVKNFESKTFDVVLKAGKTHSLVVQYVASFGQDERASLHPVYRLDYLLHPASYWSDFNELTIQIDVPSRSSVHVNLLMEKEGSYTFKGNFDNLPEEDIVLFISPSSGLFIDLFNTRISPFLFLISLVVVFYIAMQRSVLQNKWFSICLLLVFSYAGYDILSHKILGYPFTAIQYFIFIGYILILLVISLIKMKRIDLKRGN
ncbi:hypothetical protein GMD78_19525 [Ornithinibacillus sp. L9]|uniref:Uncharacterized protein n=1 Tax=Ornithinibacillus caprae TaxID=2678566 RepID=A0A6N8FMX9_9BACI|nr:hypothetical protein [Ornithinibacillus caprae]MUK90551.1 hypothetical protein [Ornithinibacillus caprae]